MIGFIFQSKFYQLMPRPKNTNPLCNAPTSTGNKCKYHTNNKDGHYCERHLYLNNYTEDMLNNLHKCQRCTKMIHIDQSKCDTCQNYVYVKKTSNKTNDSDSLCKSIVFDKKTKSYRNCQHKHLTGEEYCKDHQNNQNQNDDNIVKCKKCHKITDQLTNDLCESCIDRDRKYKDDLSSLKCKGRVLSRKSNDKSEIKQCQFRKTNGEEYCNNHLYMKEYTNEMLDNLEICSKCHKLYNGTCNTCTKNKSQCKYITYDGNQCKFNTNVNKRFCNVHHSYLEEFSNEEIKQFTYCSGCRKLKLIIGDYKTCNDCSKRSQLNNKTKSQNTTKCSAIKQNGVKCGYKIHNNTVYCKLHQNYQPKDPNLKYCSKTGCHAISSDTNRLCEYHRNQRNEYEKSTRLSYNHQSNQCRNHKCQQMFEPYQTKSGKSPTLCLDCYNRQCEVESNREPRKRNWAEELRNNPERAKKIQQYRENLKNTDIERLRNYYIKSRSKKIAELGIDEYHRINNENIKIYRDQHKELIKMISNKSYNNPNTRLARYKTLAENKNIPWLLTDDEVYQLYKSPCFYCGFKDDNKLNGIDRIDFDGPYSIENSVPCCKHCNYMKGCLDVNYFIGACIKIVLNNFDNENTTIFKEYCNNFETYDSLSCNYNRYKNSAIDRCLIFELAKNNFYNITENDCYCCGKKNTDFHQNGLDRLDSNIGYNLENVKSCCSSCNYMKNKQSVDEFLERCMLISDKHYKTFDTNCITDDTSSIKSYIDKEKKKDVMDERQSKKLMKQQELNEFYSKPLDEIVKIKLAESIERYHLKQAKINEQQLQEQDNYEKYLKIVKDNNHRKLDKLKKVDNNEATNKLVDNSDFNAIKREKARLQKQKQRGKDESNTRQYVTNRSDVEKKELARLRKQKQRAKDKRNS